jgi:hypothetical protein
LYYLDQTTVPFPLFWLLLLPGVHSEIFLTEDEEHYFQDSLAHK